MLTLVFLYITFVPLFAADNEPFQCISADSKRCFHDLSSTMFSPEKLVQLIRDGINHDGLCQHATNFDKDFQNCFETGDRGTLECFDKKFGVQSNNIKEYFKLYFTIVEKTRDYLCNILTVDEVEKLRRVDCAPVFKESCPGVDSIANFPPGLTTSPFWTPNQTELVCASYIEFAGCASYFTELCSETFDFTSTLSKYQLNDVICNVTRPFTISSAATWKTSYFFTVLTLYFINKIM